MPFTSSVEQVDWFTQVMTKSGNTNGWVMTKSGNTNGAVMPFTSSVKQVDWFTQVRDIHAGFHPCGRDPQFSAVTWDLNVLRLMT
eukprot:2137970-Pyramimonas_sp.AAC.1